MADLQVILKFVIIFSFFASDAILTSEGRSIKSAWNYQLREINNDQMHKKESQSLTPSQSPTHDDHPDVGKEKVPSPETHDQVANPVAVEAAYKDDFRPTTPGSSPGVGHSFVGSKKKAPSGDQERLTVAEILGDFRPTGPGHSPGVGHVYESKNDEPKA